MAFKILKRTAGIYFVGRWGGGFGLHALDQIVKKRGKKVTIYDFNTCKQPSKIQIRFSEQK